MDNYQLTIGFLYEDLMNIYGDTGNVTALKRRAEWRGIEVKVKKISLRDKLKPGEVDIYFFGGGQDQSQDVVAQDIQSKAKVIKEDVERGVPLLSICGGYQLLGEYYQPFEGSKLKGIGIFPAYTKASHDRMIGNIVIQIDSLINRLTGKLVGFENHSGKTYLKKGAQALGKVIKGFGNNGEDKTEGCIYKNAIGCYMHGSLLPKNPELTDWLLKKALETKYGSPRFTGEAGKKIELNKLDDEIEQKAHDAATKRFG